ncbi:MAG TPA: PIN domain-containing protein, partial [Solirubrobacterales bacterium]|nr:PIN domain-containing protein [Solirubrobacterales bacterium]
MSALLLDTHVVHWWSAEPDRVSAAASRALEAADELVVAAITWYELAWLARHERIVLNVPVRSWLEGLGRQLQTISVTPAIADAATSLPASFPGDP